MVLVGSSDNRSSMITALSNKVTIRSETHKQQAIPEMLKEYMILVRP